MDIYPPAPAKYRELPGENVHIPIESRRRGLRMRTEDRRVVLLYERVLRLALGRQDYPGLPTDRKRLSRRMSVERRDIHGRSGPRNSLWFVPFRRAASRDGQTAHGQEDNHWSALHPHFGLHLQVSI